MKKIPEYFIESPHAAEPGCQRNFRHGHLRFMDELLGKEDAPSLCHTDGRGSQMLKEQSPELAFAQAKAFCQLFYTRTVAIESAIGDESQCAGNCVRSSAPRGQIGSSLRPATEAWAKARFLRRGR